MFYEVIIDAEETANKCTIAPLVYRPDFTLFRVKGQEMMGPLTAPILLHHEGQCLTVLRKSLGKVQGVSSIDCVWHRLDLLLRRVSGRLPQLARIPDGFRTAYPRKSAQQTDPASGLATIEAIFVAGALLGNWDVSLLSQYYFGRQFVEFNAGRFLELGVPEASDLGALPVLSPRFRHSLQRRRDRGRA